MTKSRMMHRLRDFLHDESGATAIEYAIIAAGVAMVIAVVVFSLGTAVQGKFQSVSNAMK